MRRVFRIGLGSALALAMVGLWGLLNARADPVVRRAVLGLPDWPKGARPVTVALLSDVHFGSVVMDAPRLTRIVAQVNALHPDLVVIAGDFVSGHDPAGGAAAAADMAAPLRTLRAPLGVVAVRGNHDNWTDGAAVHAALRRAGATPLENWAVERGPLALGGVADVTRPNDIVGTARLMRALPGAKVLIAHEPDYVHSMPDDLPLLLAGHTHCGQAVLPVVGVVRHSGRDPRLLCGIVRSGRHTIVITGGLGTSVVPMRFGAPPDLWLLTLGPRR